VASCFLLVVLLVGALCTDMGVEEAAVVVSFIATVLVFVVVLLLVVLLVGAVCTDKGVEEAAVVVSFIATVLVFVVVLLFVVFLLIVLLGVVLL